MSPARASSASFEELGWARRSSRSSPAPSGIVFPVHAERGQCGLLVFLGPEIALAPEGMFDIHARCFSLFDARRAHAAGRKREIPIDLETRTRMPEADRQRLHQRRDRAAAKLSVHTANQYLTNTTQKLNAVNRMHAVAKALRMGLIE